MERVRLLSLRSSSSGPKNSYPKHERMSRAMCWELPIRFAVDASSSCFDILGTAQFKAMLPSQLDIATADKAKRSISVLG